MNKKIKKYLIIAFSAFIAACTISCQSSRPEFMHQRALKDLSPKDVELRGFMVSPEKWLNPDTTIMKNHIRNIITEINDANNNTVFFVVKENEDVYFRSAPESFSRKPSNNTEESDPLNIAVGSAREQDLKIYAVLDLPEAGILKSKNSNPTHLASKLKTDVRNMVMNYGIDGLGFTGSAFNPDLIEEISVEAMLIKPYLVISLVPDEESGYAKALRCLENGIVDLVIPAGRIAVAEPYHYPDKAEQGYDLKKIRPEQVVRLNLTPMFTDDPAGKIIKIKNDNKTKVTDGKGCISFVTSERDTIKLQTPAGNVTLSTSRWSPPYIYTVLPGNSVTRESPWVEFRCMPREFTQIPEYELLCRTEYPASVKINGDSVRQYRTGIFFKKITLKEGPNRIRADVITKDSLTVLYEREFMYSKSEISRPVYPLWIDERSVEPFADMELLPGDILNIRFIGSAGQDAHVVVNPGNKGIRCSRKDLDDHSIYQAELPLGELKKGKEYSITLRLDPVDKNAQIKPYKLSLQNTITVREMNDFPLVRIINENSRLIYNAGEIRLGGPIRSELGPGIILKTNGRNGDNYRVHLSSIENGMISKNDISELPPEAVKRSYYITSLSCGPAEGADILSIPYPEPIPYEVHPEPNQNRIVVTLFGAETSSTWITHRSGRKIIDKVTWEQPVPETYKIYVNLKTPDIWGYDIRPFNNSLILRIKHPPEYDLKNEKPLSGLKIAIEAGHGGQNTGAIGLSGLLEKDINLDLSFKLGDLCRSMGAEIIQVRDSDKDMSLIEKRDIAISSDADMLISIHANAGGRGYLQVGGTSTYYHNPFWAPLAETVYESLLQLGLDEFGVVGSFNYTVTRVSQMPSVLVEQAFLSHAGDEEKLADPVFRQHMAEKICDGIINYLRYMDQ